MTEVHKSRAAEIDLDNNWYYIAADNPDAAGAFLCRRLDRCQSYAHRPSLGKSRGEPGREVRCFSVEKYVVYDKPIAEGIELIRVLHGARDIQQLRVSIRLYASYHALRPPQSAPRVRGESPSLESAGRHRFSGHLPRKSAKASVSEGSEMGDSAKIAIKAVVPGT